jgi:prepilin-type N-terminal cleavage/methylation domain-containing protein
MGNQKFGEESTSMIENFRKRGEGGFTLIELLVVIAIIGILAAIAIPQFAAYRRRGFEAQATSALKNMATAQEAYFVTNNAYSSCGGAVCTSGTPPGWNATGVVNVTSSGGTTGFTLTATHNNCVTGTWTYTNTAGAVAGGPCT